ncbi:Guanine nucleotide-binding protein subunit beta-2 [Eumeta japonica]|uniref:Guanine nucleotide-binding protein subunit beta-2 n=1 Tax=Eumeta variegata TaxID=151549 RepID=A0A4C1TCA5_EUMVA|nr:Guanine nucleotide-binding protein subunit beta-2 [Eumeta japonica]
MPKDDPETTALKKELKDLIDKVKADQEKVADAKLDDKCADLSGIPKIRLSTQKTLKGHINKVNSVHYSSDSRHCVTGSLDGKLIIWDTWSGNKVQVIPLRSSWVMSVAFAPSGNFVGMSFFWAIHGPEIGGPLVEHMVDKIKASSNTKAVLALLS